MSLRSTSGLLMWKSAIYYMHGLSALFMPVMIDHALFTCYDGFPKISLELDISNTYYEFDPIVSTKTSLNIPTPILTLLNKPKRRSPVFIFRPYISPKLQQQPNNPQPPLLHNHDQFSETKLILLIQDSPAVPKDKPHSLRIFLVVYIRSVRPCLSTSPSTVLSRLYNAPRIPRYPLFSWGSSLWRVGL